MWTLMSQEPIAIVGIGCRFPGAPDVETFWRVLRDGVETVGEYPGRRFDSLDGGAYGSRIGYVHAQRACLAAFGLESPRVLFELVGGASGQDRTRARLRHLACDRQTDAAACPGDQS